MPPSRRKSQRARPVPPVGPESKEDLRALLAAVRSLVPLPGTAYEAGIRETIESLALILESKVLYEVEGDFGPPLVVVVTGGTNVGKSEVFNALIGAAVALPDPRAGMTRNPAVWVHAVAEPRLSSPSFLPGAEKEILHQRARLNSPELQGGRKAFLWPHENAAWKDLALVDSPDVDSNRAGNQSWALRLAAAADVLVFVTSPSKYNDEACVAFLREALALDKRVVVAFNLLPADAGKVLLDFRDSVWRGLSDRALELVELPLAPGDVSKALSGPLKGVQRSLLKEAKDPGPLKRAGAAAAFRRFREGTAAVLEVLAREDRAVEEVRARLTTLAEDARRAYRARAEKAEFLELEEVFHEVLKIFRVPVLDDVLGLPRTAFSWVQARLGRASGGATLAEKIAARRRADLQWIRERVEAARLTLTGSLAESERGSAAEVVARRLKEAAYDRPPNAQVEAIAREGEARIEAWIEETRREIVASIEGHPYLKRFLKSARVLLQVGAGVLVAVLTGGFGSADLVLGPAAATFAHYFIETFGSAYFNDKRRTFVALQTEKFDTILSAALLTPFEAALPARPERSDPAAVEGAVARLEKIFPGPETGPSREALTP